MEFTIQQFLQMRSTEGAQLLTAQRSASGRMIRSISVMEGPVEDFVRRDELVLTIAAELWGHPKQFLSFTREVRDAGATALAISIRSDKQELPACVLQFCMEQEFPLILLPWERRFSEIIEEAHQCLHRSQLQEIDAYEELRRELFASYLSNGTLSDAAQILSRRESRPFCIADRAGRARGVCQAWRHTLPVGEEVQMETFPLCLRIRSEGQQYGYLLAGAPEDGLERPLQREYLEKYAALPLSLWFDREQTISATRLRLKNDFVRHLAKGEFHSMQEAQEQAELMGFRIDLAYICILGRIHSEEPGGLPDGLSESWDTLLSHLLRIGRAHHRALMTTYQQDMLILYLENPEGSTFGELHRFLDEVEKQFLQVSPGTLWRWGIGKLYPEEGQFHQEYLNARLALELCEQQPGSSRLAYQDTRIHRILSAISENRVVRQVAQELMDRLAEDERVRHLELVSTFRCYLKNNCNVSQTARELHLHRQSLIYRLHRLEEASGLSLESCNDRFLLELCVRISTDFSLGTEE